MLRHALHNNNRQLLYEIVKFCRESKADQMVRSQCFMFDKDYSVFNRSQWHSSYNDGFLAELNHIPCKNWKYDATHFKKTVTSEILIIFSHI